MLCITYKVNDSAERKASHEAFSSSGFQKIFQPWILFTVSSTHGKIQLQKDHTVIIERTQSHNSAVSEAHWIITGWAVQ